MTEQEYDKEQLKILRNAFKAFDHDERGYIEHSDVQSILEILGQKLDEKAIKALLNEVDKGNSGKLDFSQFCRLGARFIEVEEDPGALAAELKEAFRVYDREGKGYLTVQVLRDILHELDDKLSNNDLDMIIEEIDADGSGTVDFDEFMQVMTGNNYADLVWHHRFAFDPIQIKPNVSRLRLHRRIEWHFERFFERISKPFDAALRYQQAVAKTNKPHLPARPPRPACSSVTSISYNEPVLSKDTTCFRTSVTKQDEDAKRTTSISKCACRPPYRPRFPKWIPVMVLYRELLQNPFRSRRPRHMIAYY